MTSSQLVLALLDEAYEKKTWHGPNLRQSLKAVSAKQAARRPGPGRHNIWEVMLHAAYWKYAVRRRIEGGKRGSFVLKGSNFSRGRKKAKPPKPPGTPTRNCLSESTANCVQPWRRPCERRGRPNFCTNSMEWLYTTSTTRGRSGCCADCKNANQPEALRRACTRSGKLVAS